MGWSVRAAAAGDVAHVVALVRETLLEFGLTFGEGSATDAELHALPGSYEGAGGRFWIAVDDDSAIVGTCGCVPVGGGDYEIRKMYLRPAARGRGVGKALLETALGFARDAGAKRLVLDTVEQMTDAITFYERNGFVRDDAQVRGARCSRGYSRAL